MNPFEVHIFVSGNRKSSSLLYPVRQLNHIRRVDAEEDVQDFGVLGPGFDSLQVIMLLLGAERALHRCRHHSGKLSLGSYARRLLFNPPNDIAISRRGRSDLIRPSSECLEGLYISLIKIVLCKCNPLLSVR